MIEYGIIDSSIKYYEKLGYQRVESPWTVSESIDTITRPKELKMFSDKTKHIKSIERQKEMLSLVMSQ